MPKRELFALVAVPAVVAAILWLPGWVVPGIVAGAVLVAGDEMLTMSRRAGARSGRWLPLFLLAALLASSWWFGAVGLVVAAALVVLVMPLAHLARGDGPAGSLAGVAVATFVVLFLGITGACLGWLRLLPSDGQAIPFFLFYLATIWIGDSGAYYVGSHLGRRAMAPRISPNKTWEGLTGGVLATLAAAAALKPAFEIALPWPHLAAVAVIVAVATPLGDLVESQFKRDTGVKDSSSLLPGHGGVLDRTDSLLYTAPPVLGYLLAAGVMP